MIKNHQIMSNVSDTIREYQNRILNFCGDLPRDPYLVLAECSTVSERLRLDESLKDYREQIEEVMLPLRSIAQKLWEKMID